MWGQGASPGRIVIWVVCLLTIAFLFAPIIVIVITSFNDSQYMQFPPHKWSLRWYENFFTSAHWYEPALLSFRVAAITMINATILGTLAAIGIVRGRFPGRKIIELFFVSPIVVPVIVLAVGLYFLFSAMHLIGDPTSIYLGHTVIATPLVTVVVSAALRTSDPSMELAARSLGANFPRTLWRVTIPTVRPAILSGALFAFLISFDEVVIAIFLGGPRATTLPKRMWDSIRFEIDPTLSAISSMLAIVAICVLIGVELVRRHYDAKGAAAAGQSSN
jgi:putative spermidine/putrescine transport system permease protein